MNPVTPTPPPAAASNGRRRWAPRSWPRRLLAAAARAVLGLLLLATVLAATLWWAVRSEAGIAWVVSRLPGLEVTAPRGRLLGDFEAERVVLTLSNGGGRIVLGNVAWRGLKLMRSDAPALWARLAFAELRAARIDVELAPSTQPAGAPTGLALPVPLQIEIDALRIDALHADALGEQPLREVRARVVLGAQGGEQHRVEQISAAWDRLLAMGQARIGTAAPLVLEAQLNVTQARAVQASAAPVSGAASAPLPSLAGPAIDTQAWQATLALAGPLEAPTLTATVRAPATATHPEQSLLAQAGLRPFAAWPLADVQARTQAFDLSALSASAPITSLTGEVTLQSEAADQPIHARIALSNAKAGRWNDGYLPLRRLSADMVGRADERSQFELKRVNAEFGNTDDAAGRLEGSGRWSPERSTLAATLHSLQPALLDARAPEMRLGGPITLTLLTPQGESAVPAADRAADTTPALPQIEVQLDLSGALWTAAGPTQARVAGPTVNLKLDARADAQHILLRVARASTTQAAGTAAATLTGEARRASSTAPWRTTGRATVVDFDPLPWWPGRTDSPWRRGPHRINAGGDFDLTLPLDRAAPLTSVRGRAALSITNSVIAGVALEGQASLRSSDRDHADTALALQVAGNRLQAQGRFATDAGAVSSATSAPANRPGSTDQWSMSLDAPVLAALRPLWRLLQPGDAEPSLAGALSATASVSGRWPALSSQGELNGSDLRLGAATVEQAQARWSVGTAVGAALDIDASLSQLRLLPLDARRAASAGAKARATSATRKAPAAVAIASPNIESAQLRLKGTVSDHTLELRANSKALPPAWTETVQAATSAAPVATSASAAAPPAPTSARSALTLRAQGGAVDVPGQRLAGWRGVVQHIELKASSPGAAPWIDARDIDIDTLWSGGPARVMVQPGRAEVLGAAMRWGRVSWQAALPASGGARGQPMQAAQAAQIDAQISIDPLPLAPLLARLQPDFGWGGDLAVGGRIDLQSAGGLAADIVLSRSTGDLTVTDEISTQSLGLTDLRLALNAQAGVWTFSHYLNGRALGVLAGAVIARTSPDALWPRPDATLEGAAELDVAKLGAWGTWVPTGWRLGGQLKTSALFAGRFGAPEVTGSIEGRGLSARHFLDGVNISDGELLISLGGNNARIERFSAKGGAGSLTLAGGATLGESPSARLQLKADRFVLLGRVDRRIVASGSAEMAFDRDALGVNGAFAIDEGLIDFTRSDAPALSNDVQVVRRADKTPPPTEPEAAPAAPSAAARQLALDVKIALGKDLRLRGRGIETGLRGEVRLTAPGGRLAVNGTVRAADGTYAAYGQKLSIDRGLITFNGPPENPQLNIEATRPNTDIRVGVQVTGTAQNPRIRLFSEPEVSEIDKLSWLALGRASDGLGSADTALLQTAALALLAGEGDGITEQFTRAIGLDELTLKQSDVRETVISLGKQLSRRWYVGYERGLNATSGSWQLIYRIARSFTLRAQSGFENSLDAIWTWRWG